MGRASSLRVKLQIPGYHQNLTEVAQLLSSWGSQGKGAEAGWGVMGRGV